MTQTVPDISPLMPMHQDPLLVTIVLAIKSKYNMSPRGYAPSILCLLHLHCCRGTCQISKRYDNLNYQSHRFESPWDLTIRRHNAHWNGAQECTDIFHQNLRHINYPTEPIRTTLWGDNGCISRFHPQTFNGPWKTYITLYGIYLAPGVRRSPLGASYYINRVVYNTIDSSIT